jgi:hypothetical protein
MITAPIIGTVICGTICWSPHLPHFFPPVDMWLPEPVQRVERVQRAPPPPSPRATRPKPPRGEQRRTITIPGYVPPLNIPEWLHPDPRFNRK